MTPYLPEKKKEKKEDEKEDLISLFEQLAKFEEIELEDVEMEFSDLELWFQSAAPANPTPSVRKMVPSNAKAKPAELRIADFAPPIEQYPGQVVEVTLGATKSQGGSRGKTITIGGEKSPAFYTFENPTPHRPIISLDVFDMKVPLAKAVKMHVKEVMEDPAAWAKLAVDKFDADMVTIHIISIDPLLKDTSPRDAAKTVENVLQAVDVPLVIGGCGDPKKDVEAFELIAEMAAGERLLFSSVTQDMDLEKVAKAINKHGHVALSFTPMDLNQARQLNRHLYDFLPKERIVMDTTTAALGYGLEYAFTIMERARLAALMGDPELQHPMSSGTTNAWAAREAWMDMSPEWDPRELRGPLWEVLTATNLLLAGVDLFMMMHPAAVKTLRDIITELASENRGKTEKIANWVSMKI